MEKTDREIEAIRNNIMMMENNNSTFSNTGKNKLSNTMKVSLLLCSRIIRIHLHLNHTVNSNTIIISILYNV